MARRYAQVRLEGSIAAMLKNVLFAVPVFGWMLKSAWYGDMTEKLFFLANVLALWGFAIYVFGYGALIVPLLVIVAVYLVTLVILTAGDLFSNERPVARRAARPDNAPGQNRALNRDRRRNGRDLGLRHPAA